MAKKPAAEKADETPMLALIEVPNVETPTVNDQARIVLLDQGKSDEFYEKVKAEAAKHVPDVSTAGGRDALRSLAFRVTKTATTLDKAALELTADMRARVKAVNDARGPMVERMKALAAEVRKPLTDWEDAEEARNDANRATIDEIRQAKIVSEDDTSETVHARGIEIWERKFEAPQWTPEEAVEAENAKLDTVQHLAAARKRLRQEEADKAELAALRVEAARRAERDEAERIEREEREAAEAAKRAEDERIEREAREAKEAEEAAARAEQQRIERERREAEEREREAAERERVAAEQARDAARREAEEAAARAAEEREAAHQRELAAAQAERDRIAEEAAKAQREREAADAARIAAEQRREEEARQAAAEEAKRQRNRDHRKAITAEVEAAMIEAAGITPEQAKAIVLSIVGGGIPHTAVSF